MGKESYIECGAMGVSTFRCGVEGPALCAG